MAANGQRKVFRTRDGFALSPRERPAEACEENRNKPDERAMRRPVHEVSARGFAEVVGDQPSAQRSCGTSIAKPGGQEVRHQTEENQ